MDIDLELNNIDYDLERQIEDYKVFDIKYKKGKISIVVYQDTYDEGIESDDCDSVEHAIESIIMILERERCRY